MSIVTRGRQILYPIAGGSYVEESASENSLAFPASLVSSTPLCKCELLSIISVLWAVNKNAKLPSKIAWEKHTKLWNASSAPFIPLFRRSTEYPPKIKLNKKKYCEVATTPPMNNPVKNELWNFRITIVPPTESMMSMSVDHTEANASGDDRVETVQNDSKVSRNVIAKIVYLYL